MTLALLQADRDSFLARQRDQRRASPHTLAAYQRECAELLAQMEAAAVVEWSALQAAHLRRWLADAHRRGLAAKSLQRRLSAWRSWFDYLVEIGRLRVSPALGVRAPKAARRLPQVLDADEARQLVELNVEDDQSAADRAMLELFYSSGLRLSELCALRWADLDAREAELRVVGKGRKVRIVPVGRRALEALQAWAERCHQRSDYMFPGRQSGPISARTVQRRLKLLAQQQGVWKRVHPHLLRHSCASHLLESSGELRAVQELLGHADIGTTQIYTHLDFQHLAKVYDAAHPRARRKTEPRD
ncbi:tyrosine recombinase XerC [Pseudomarimonas arenosa]|uniref:Tyrosine recombinase XerC n=1 Tax=Pseudomarimonas arenosa TaxID=2774145 RepID=A0AAW3ZGA7_9GAMM|nr:tyrosine recombinase XerC [Pseudomarimonas arenosa]MBD8525165.1 tyrosine recombinase XerC [Pseudomarimonas arenosa]